MANKRHMVTLYDYNYREKSDVINLANTFAKNFPDHKPLKDFVRNLFITRTDENFKLNLKEIAATLDYSGFDPVTTLQSFFDKGNAIQTDEEWPIYADENNQTSPIIVINSKDINQHIVLHLIFFVLRGTNVEKAVKKIQKQWVAPIKWVFTTYGSFKPPKAKDMDKKTITISRIAACFPHVVCYFLSKGIGKTYIDTAVLDNVAGMNTPRAMLTNMFIGLVMRGQAGDIFLPYVKVYHYFLDVVLQRNQGTPKSLDRILKDVEQFTTAARSSSLYDDDTRRFFTYMLGLTKRNGEPVDEVLRTLEAGKTLWTVIVRSGSTAEVNTNLRALTPAANTIVFDDNLAESTVLDILDDKGVTASMFYYLSTSSLDAATFQAFVETDESMNKVYKYIMKAQSDDVLVREILNCDLYESIHLLYMIRLILDPSSVASVYQKLLSDRSYVLNLTTQLGSPSVNGILSKTPQVISVEQQKQISMSICADEHFFEAGGLQPSVQILINENVRNALDEVLIRTSRAAAGRNE